MFNTSQLVLFRDIQSLERLTLYLIDGFAGEHFTTKRMIRNPNNKVISIKNSSLKSIDIEEENLICNEGIQFSMDNKF